MGEKRDAGAVLQELVHSMVELLVDVPKEVEVFLRQEGRTVFLQVHVVQKDVGYVIGKQGRTARSLRTIAQHAAMKLNVVCDLNFDEYAKVGDGARR